MNYEDILCGVVSISGKQGPQGPKGDRGTDGNVSFNELTEEQRESLRGPEGKPFTYEDFTPEQLAALVGPQGEVGPQGPQGPQGEQGPAGKDGQNGAPGVNGVDGKTPERGVDYWTAADKAEIVNEVLTSLPVYNGEVV